MKKYRLGFYLKVVILNEERMKYPKHKILSQSLIEILLPSVIRMTKYVNLMDINI